MSRRHRAEKRQFSPIPSSVICTFEVHELLMLDGKKSAAERSFMVLLASLKPYPEALQMFHEALENIAHRLKFVHAGLVVQRTRFLSKCVTERASGTCYSLADRLHARNRTKHDDRASFGELMDAAINRGRCIKKREDTHRMAEANRVLPLSLVIFNRCSPPRHSKR